MADTPPPTATPTSNPKQTITFYNATLILPTSPIPVPHSTLNICTATGLITVIHPGSSSDGSSSSSSNTPASEPHSPNDKSIDLSHALLTPGFLDLQINGLAGVHFTRLTPSPLPSNTPSLTPADPNSPLLHRTSLTQARAGVTAFWATIPTVPHTAWPGLISALRPRSFFVAGDDDGTKKRAVAGAELLGVHCEGPFLEGRKRGAHCEAFMVRPDAVGRGEGDRGGERERSQRAPGEATHDIEDTLYGLTNLESGAVKMITLAPELPGAVELIARIRRKYPWIRVAMGHSKATYAQGLEGVGAGACMVTHTFNAMEGVVGREPGLAGLMVGDWAGCGGEGGGGGSVEGEGKGKGKVWYSIIGDGVHLHPTVMEMAMQLGMDEDGNGGGRCIGITDAIELAGLEDGVYEGNEQIKGRQVKSGNRVTIEGTDTLVGSCVLVDGVVRTLAGVDGRGEGSGGQVVERGRGQWAKMSEEEKGRRLVRAVKAVSQNVADMMGEEGRGRLVVGKRADLVVLDWDGVVRQTWVGGRRVYERETA